MKLIKTINANASAYAGGKKSFVEFTFKPAPKFDENNNEIPANRRYYVLRILNFEGPDRTDYPFIIRNEHVCYHHNAEGKVTSVDRIVCPTTSWAKNKLYQNGEHIGRGYCPICQYSFDKNKEAWKIPGHPDRTSIRLSNETKAVWNAYIPVYVVRDPNYPQNNQHLKVLHLTGENGKNILDRLTAMLNDNTSKGLNCYNGENGANIGFLCESVQKTHHNKNGEVSINKKTGKPYVYTENVITDMRTLQKNLYSYPEINDSTIDELDFDGTYGVPAYKDELSAFLNKNWLDIGGGDDDFDDVEVNNTDFEAPTVETSHNTVKSIEQNEEITDIEDDFDADVSNNSNNDGQPKEKSAEDMINDVIGNSSMASSVHTVKKTTIPPSTEEIRNDTSDGNVDMSDLPF